MSAVILDASAYSAMQRGDKAVLKKVEKASLIIISPILTGELGIGFLGGGKREENLNHLDHFINETGILWVDIDLDTADRYSILSDMLRRKGKTIPVNDVWLAALAWQHGYKVLTLDNHFDLIPQVLRA